MNAERIMDESGDAGRCVAHIDVADTLHFYTSTLTSCLRCGGEAELDTYGRGVSGVGTTAVVLKRTFSRPSHCYRLQVGESKLGQRRV
jgi:hypothetical protein